MIREGTIKLPPPIETTKAEVVALATRMTEMARRPQGQRRIIEATIEHALKPDFEGWYGLVLENPTSNPNDPEGIVDWTVAPRQHEQFRDIVTNRIRRGYLPVGMVDVKEGNIAILAHWVPPEYFKDLVRWAEIEGRVVLLTLIGKVSPMDSWFKDGGAKQ